MNNEQIIANIAIESGYLTPERVEELINDGQEIPLHTLKGWAHRGFNIKEGEHGIEARIWRKRKKNKNDDQDKADSEVENRDFYLTKAFLFTADQTVPR